MHTHRRSLATAGASPWILQVLRTEKKLTCMHIFTTKRSRQACKTPSLSALGTRRLTVESCVNVALVICWILLRLARKRMTTMTDARASASVGPRADLKGATKALAPTLPRRTMDGAAHGRRASASTRSQPHPKLQNPKDAGSGARGV